VNAGLWASRALTILSSTAAIKNPCYKLPIVSIHINYKNRIKNISGILALSMLVYFTTN